MMVGSILTSVTEGQSIKRGDELGYFAFGGSTVVCLFEKGVVELDEDLAINGRASLETLVRVGMGLGRRKGVPPSQSGAAGSMAEMGAAVGGQARGLVSGAREEVRGLADGAKGVASGLKGLATGGSNKA